MAKARLVSTKFWSDNWIVDELNPLDRYLFLYLLTNEKTNIIGVYELSLRTMANETGIDKEELQRMITRIESRVLYIDGWVVFRNAIKHQNYKSPRIEPAIARELSNAPPQTLQHIQMPDDLRKMMVDIYGIDTVSIGYVYDITLNNNNNPNNNNNLTITQTINPLSRNGAETGKPVRRLEPIPKEQIDEILNRWEVEIGYKVGNETGNRRAIAALIRQHGIDGTVRMIAGVKLALDDQYAPRVSDFVSLKRKQNDLMVWGRKRNASKRNKVAIIS